MTGVRKQRNRWALSGVLFVVYFIVGLIVGGVLADSPYPMPDVPATQTARFYGDNATAILIGVVFQIFSAVALFVFVGCVAAVTRREAGEKGALPRLIRGIGALAAVLLLASALFSGALVLVAGGGDPSTVGALRDGSFLTGGVAHVVFLGLFAGAASVVAAKTRTLPRWVARLGIVAAVASVLSLASLVWFPATFLIPLGRLLSFAWCVAAGLVLAFGRRRDRDGR